MSIITISLIKRKNIEKVENIMNYSDRDETEVIAKLFLITKRDMERKSNTLSKNISL